MAKRRKKRTAQFQTTTQETNYRAALGPREHSALAVIAEALEWAAGKIREMLKSPDHQ